MKTPALPTLLYLLPITHALPAKLRKPRYTRVVVFGDSFSDNGTGAWDVSNHTWPSDPAYHAHSFTNGPVWPTLLAHTLNASLLDFATGGATASNALVQGFTGPNASIPVPSASEQVSAFLAGGSPVSASDVVVHYIGANDVLFDTSVAGAQVASWIDADVQRLYAAGARHLLLANYPPVSSFPATYNDSTYAAIGPVYAAALDRGLASVRAAWATYLHIGVVDVRGLFAEIVAEPEKFGVRRENVDPPTACLQGTYGGGERSVCEDPERYLFWDGYHPVAPVHGRIAELLAEAVRAW